MNNYQDYYTEFMSLGYGHRKSRWRAIDELRRWDNKLVEADSMYDSSYFVTQPDILMIINLNQIISCFYNERWPIGYKKYFSLLMLKYGVLPYFDDNNRVIAETLLPSEGVNDFEDKNLMILAGYKTGKNSDRVKHQLGIIFAELLKN